MRSDPELRASRLASLQELEELRVARTRRQLLQLELVQRALVVAAALLLAVSAGIGALTQALDAQAVRALAGAAAWIASIVVLGPRRGESP